MLRVLTTSMAVLLVAIGCGDRASSRGPSTAPSPPTAGATPVAAITSSAAPSRWVRRTRPSPSPATSPADPPADPPGAVLSAGGIQPIEGEIGSYTFDESGSDGPWLPATALRPVSIRAGAAISIRLRPGGRITSWVARISPASDEQGEIQEGLARGGSGGEGARVIRFAGPERGSWVLMVEVTYARGRGSGAYYWRLEVE